jgi:hypothetical protein
MIRRALARDDELSLLLIWYCRLAKKEELEMVALVDRY